MSSPDIIAVNCQACGLAQGFTAWRSLNASISPDARAALLAGTLLRFQCEKCGTTAIVAYPLLYHDPDRQFMVWWIPEPAQTNPESLPSQGFLRNYQFRSVRTPNQLVEKIRIFESGWDDRLVEIIKVVLRRGAASKGRSLDGELLFVRPEDDGAGQAVRFALFAPDGRTALTIPAAAVESIRNAMGERLSPLKAVSGKWLIVDQDYADTIVNDLRDSCSSL